MSELLDLPDELLLLIFNELNNGDCYGDWYEDGCTSPTSTFSTLALVCRRLNGLATPCLYSTITPMEAMDSLIPTLIKHPKTAERVRHIHWSYNFNLGHPSVTASRSRIEDTLENTNVPNASLDPQCKVTNSQTRTDDFLTTLLGYAPNLRHLSITNNNSKSTASPTPAWLKMLDTSPTTHIYFKHLTQLQISTPSLPLNALHPIFYIPTLTNLGLTNISQPTPSLGPTWETSPPPKRSLPITHISLDGKPMNSQAIATLLSYIRSLKSLTIRIHSSAFYFNNPTPTLPLQHRILMDACRAHKDTLHTLELFDCRDLGHKLHHPATDTLGDMSMLEHVSFLICHIQALGYPQSGAFLPPRVRTLALIVDRVCFDWVMLLEAWAKGCESRLGRPDMVDVLLPAWFRGSLYWTGRLGLEFRRWGVEVEFFAQAWWAGGR